MTKFELQSFTVGDGSTYKFRALSPFDALDFGTRVAKLLAPAISEGASIGEALGRISSTVSSKELSDLLKEALGYCYTPQSEALDNEAVFNAWFSEHPDELFEAGIKAVYNLVLPFLPKAMTTLTDGTKSRKSTENK